MVSSAPVIEGWRGWLERLAFWLTLALTFSIPWEDVVEIPGFGTPTKMVGVLAAVVWASSVLARGRVRKPQLYHWLTLFFIAWNALTLLWSVDPEATSRQVTTYAQSLVLVFLLWDLVNTPARLRAALQSYVLGTLVSMAALVGNFQAGTGFNSRRFTAGGFHPNVLAFILALGVPVAADLAMRGKNPWLRIANLASVPLALYGILLTGSRSAFVGALLGVGLLFVTVLRARPPLRMTLVPAALGLVALSVIYAPSQSVERVEGTSAEIAGDDWNGRVRVWREGLDIFYQRPLQGAGSGAFQSAVSSGRPPHNFVISLLAELGLPGLLSYLGLLAVAAYHGLKGRQPLLWLTILVVWLMGAVVHNIEDKKQTWLFLTLAVASQRPISRAVEYDGLPLV
jgi:O-antigen ligase